MPDPSDSRNVTRLRQVICLATLVMIGLSWPLWVEPSEIPRVPFFLAIPRPGPIASWVLFIAWETTILLTAVGRRWRAWFLASLALLFLLVGQDQHRFQPWLYQYAMTLLLLAALPSQVSPRFVRWWYVATYLHSGLSKLDVSFCDELGLLFLATALPQFGLDPTSWPRDSVVRAVLTMPIAEIAVALLLLVPRMRQFGVYGAIFLHGALICILGPRGLDHSTIVLVWNAAMAAEVWLAFGALSGGHDPTPENTSIDARLSRALSAAVVAVFWAGVVLPFGERWGVFDIWPSHALYASHVERIHVSVLDSELEAYPESIRQHFLSGTKGGPYRQLNLTEWSRASRGTPVYPQNRASLGIAEGLEARYGNRGHVLVVLWGPADRWTGARDRNVAGRLESIRELADQFWINARTSDRLPR